MSKKAHGTTAQPVQHTLRWNCNRAKAEWVCCFNRNEDEGKDYAWSQGVTWEQELKEKGEVNFYDSVSGKPLFIVPRGRTVDEFLDESKAHGWPSFRDEEVIWENVRCVKHGTGRLSGETVSLDGTHLGHNLPDEKGNRYCINLVSVAGNPALSLLEQIKARNQDFAEAFASGKAASVADLFTTDGSVLPQNGTKVTSHAGLTAFW